MGNKYKGQALRAIDTTWSRNQPKSYMSLPRNLNVNRIHNYDDNNNVSTSQYSTFYTLRKSKSSKSLNKGHNNTALVLLEGNPGSSLCLQKDSTNNENHIAVWGGKSFNKDELDKLKAYISNNNIKTFSITLFDLMDYKNVLTRLFGDVVSDSPKIEQLCINIAPIAESKLTEKYLEKLLLLSIKALNKPELQCQKNINIGSNNPSKPISDEMSDKILRAALKVNKKDILKDETYCPKLSIAVSDNFNKCYDKVQKKYSQKVPLKTVNYDPSNTSVALDKTITMEFFPKVSFFKKFSNFCNTFMGITKSHQSACAAEDTNFGAVATDDQDFLHDNVVLSNELCKLKFLN